MKGGIFIKNRYPELLILRLKLLAYTGTTTNIIKIYLLPKKM